MRLQLFQLWSHRIHSHFPSWTSQSKHQWRVSLSDINGAFIVEPLKLLESKTDPTFPDRCILTLCDDYSSFIDAKIYYNGNKVLERNVRTERNFNYLHGGGVWILGQDQV